MIRIPPHALLQAAAKLKISKSSPLLNLNKEERRQVKEREKRCSNHLQVTEWLDLERNSAILEKTDKAIADKLREGAGLGGGGGGRFSSDLRVKSAAQVTQLTNF